MALEPIKLDDLTWSEMVIAIRRRIAAASGGKWTLHAPVDPGVTLLELFAWLLEQRVFWMDQVPDSFVRGAMRLLGEAPKPTQAAATVMRFQSADHTRLVPAMTELSLARSNAAVIFSTELEIALLPFKKLDAQRDKLTLEINSRDRTTDFEQGKVLRLFPADGKAAEVKLLLWLRERLAPEFVDKRFSLLFDLRDSSGLAPQWSPEAPADVPPPAKLTWFYGGIDGTPISFADEEVRDGTGGLRRSGLVTLPIKNGWRPEFEDAGQGAYQYPLWVRVERASFTAPPRLERLIPNVVIASHKRKTHEHELRREWLPLPGNTIALADLPEQDAVKDHPPIENTVRLKIKERDGKWRLWSVTGDLAFHGPGDRVFTVDRPRGEISYGDGLTGRLPVLAAASFTITEQALRNLKSAGLPDSVLGKIQSLKDKRFVGREIFLNALRKAIEPEPSDRFELLTLRHAGEPQLKVQYCVGGGNDGKLGANLQWEGDDLNAVNVAPAEGGAEPESIPAARERVASLIKRPTRLVTRDDYEEIARTTPGVAIKRAYAAIGFHPAHPCVPIPGAVTVFIVSDAPRPDELSQDSPEFDEAVVEGAFVAAPVPDPGALEAIRARLGEARLLASEVFVSAPTYRLADLTVEIESDAADRARLSQKVKLRLRTFLDPLIGGDNGDGWPFGEPIRPSAILREAQSELGTQGSVVRVFIELIDDEPKPNQLLARLTDSIRNDCSTLREIGTAKDKTCAAITLGAKQEAEFRKDCGDSILEGGEPDQEETCSDVAIGAHELVALRQLTVNFQHPSQSPGGLR